MHDDLSPIAEHGLAAACFAARVAAGVADSVAALRRVWPGRTVTAEFDPSTIRLFGAGRVCWNGVASIDGVRVMVSAVTPAPGPFAVGAAPVSAMCAVVVAGQVRRVSTDAELAAAAMLQAAGLEQPVLLGVAPD